MSIIGSPLILLLVVAAEGEPAPKFPVGKETTYVTGPLDKEGYIDYEAALNDRLGKDIAPEKNANVLLWKALGPTPEGGKEMPDEFFKRLGIDEPPKDGAYFIGLRAFMKDRLKLDPSEFDAIDDQQSRAAQRPWAAKDYPHIAAWLEANEKPLAVVVEATRRPEYYNPLLTQQTDNPGSPVGVWVFSPGLQKRRELGKALAARAMLRVGQGKFDDAWQDLLACHRLGRLVGRGGTLSEALVAIPTDSIACYADLSYLGRADLTAQQARDRLKDLQSLPPMPSIAGQVDLTERLTFLNGLQVIRRGGIAALNELAGGAAPDARDASADKALKALDWESALRTANAWFDRTAAALRLPDRADREKELVGIAQEIEGLKNDAGKSVTQLLLGKKEPDKAAGEAMSDFFFALMMPAIRKCQQAHDRGEQVQRNLQVAFALAAYRRDHDGYPAKLDDLAPKYLAAVPDDLFSGQALVYRPTDKGYRFYSVGVNGKDEGGRSFDDDPAGDDLPVSMPLPELKPKK